MDGRLAIERNTQALKRVLLALVAMAGLRGQFTFFPQRGALVQMVAPAEKSKLSPAFTLPRQLRNAVLRLLRSAESAARRLVIAMSRGLAGPPLPPRKNVVKPLRKVRQFMPVMPPEARVRPPLRSLALPLLDPLRRKAGRRWERQASIPRIGFGERRSLPVRPLPSPDDRLDTTRLGLRLDALRRALDDLPGHARRFARREARQRRLHASGKICRIWPLRMGRPPGSRRRPNHEVYEVLTNTAELALEALETPNTS